MRTASPWFFILWFARSLGLGAGDAHDLAPFPGFGLHEDGEILAEGGARLGAEIAEARRDVGRLERLGDRVDQSALRGVRNMRHFRQTLPVRVRQIRPAPPRTGFVA